MAPSGLIFNLLVRILCSFFRSHVCHTTFQTLCHTASHTVLHAHIWSLHRFVSPGSSADRAGLKHPVNELKGVIVDIVCLDRAESAEAGGEHIRRKNDAALAAGPFRHENA